MQTSSLGPTSVLDTLAPARSKKSSGNAAEFAEILTNERESNAEPSASTKLAQSNNLPALRDTRFEFSTAKIRRSYEESLEAIQSCLKSLLRENNVSTSPPVNLVVAGDGRVVVAGDHPQKAQIEQFFTESPALRDKFVETAAQGSFLQSVEESLAFQAAYARDPFKAVEEYADLLTNRSKQFTLSVAGDLFLPLVG